MQNSHDLYTDLGRKAAQAGNKQDDVLEQVYSDRFRKALNGEQGLGRMQAELIFNETYTAYRRIG